MRRPYLVLDVFTDRRFAGNPLAVIGDAGGMGTAAMQAIAAEFNLSETVFLLAPENPAHLARARIFTPTFEMPFAGHPTVGAAIALARLGRVPVPDDGRARFVLEELAGPVPVTVTFAGIVPVHAAFDAPQSPQLGAQVPAAALAAALGLPSAAVVAGEAMPRVASCGAAFLVAELRDLDALGAARLRDVAFVEATGAIGVFLVVRDAAGDMEGRQAWRARMFAPQAGVYEDPATGSASAAFTGLLAVMAPGAEHEARIVIRQGIEMGRPSTILAEAVKHGGVVQRVGIAGAAVPVAEGWIEVD